MAVFQGPLRFLDNLQKCGVPFSVIKLLYYNLQPLLHPILKFRRIIWNRIESDIFFSHTEIMSLILYEHRIDFDSSELSLLTCWEISSLDHTPRKFLYFDLFQFTIIPCMVFKEISFNSRQSCSYLL